ncbi:MAG: hypothetical protein OEY77_12950, partial [Nitrospira sp.]|nr:hypothetical protein [Nitrospira sp.]
MRLILNLTTRCHTAGRRFGCGAIILLALTFPIDLVTGSVLSAQAVDSHYSGRQGQILVVKVPADG